MNCQKCEEKIGKKDEWVEVSEWTGNTRESLKHYHKECLQKKDKDFKDQAEEFLDKAETWLPTVKSLLSFVPSGKSKKRSK